MTRIWQTIMDLIGPGLHWDKSAEFYREAITKAEAAGEFEAADHIRLILERREKVHCGVVYPDDELGI